MSEESKARTLGERIEEIRKEQGISIEDAASRSGIPVETWSSIESNSVNVKTRALFDIAFALDVRPKNLFV